MANQGNTKHMQEEKNIIQQGATKGIITVNYCNNKYNIKIQY